MPPIPILQIIRLRTQDWKQLFARGPCALRQIIAAVYSVVCFSKCVAC